MRTILGIPVIFLTMVAFAGQLLSAERPQKQAFFARVYLSVTEAIELQKDRSEDRVEERVFVLDEDGRNRIKKRVRVKMFTDTYTIYYLYHKGETSPYRYLVPLQEPGQHEYMDLMYGIDADGKIHRMDLLVYREPYGGEIKDPRFLRQFKGKTIRNRIRVSQDIIHIVGATISSHSVSNAARRALALLEELGLVL